MIHYYFGFKSKLTLIGWLFVYTLWCIYFFSIIISFERLKLMKDDMVRFFHSVEDALIALILLIILVNCIVYILCTIKEKYRQYPMMTSGVVVLTFLLLIWLNIYPIVNWIYFYRQEKMLYLYLLFSNMLLYYYVLHTYQELQIEKSKQYLISARFKGMSVMNYLREKWVWTILNNIRPMFYHLFSFTLFTDLLLHHDEGHGIVSHIFTLLQGQNFCKTDIWVAIGITGTFLYPLKKCMELPEKIFSNRHMIYEKGRM